jgi:hypothetical protein
MKRYMLVLLILLLVAPVAPEQSQDVKKHNFSFSLSGGSIGGKFNLAGDFSYTQESGNGLLQAAGFALVNSSQKEYGLSLGMSIGASRDKGLNAYVFVDSLYHQQLFAQVRPVVQFKLSWFSLMGYYAYPFYSGKLQINGQDVAAAKYWGIEADVVPLSFLRFYGNVKIVEQKYNTFKIGAEVRPMPWFSLSVDWNRTDTGFYSYWNSYEDFRIALNVLFGAQQQDLSPVYRKTIPVVYPILIGKGSTTITPPEKTDDMIEFMYRRDLPIITPNNPDTKGCSIWNDVYGGLILDWTQISQNQWTCSVGLRYDKSPYYIFTVDGKVITGYSSVAKTFFARVKGQADWIQLTTIEPNLRLTGEWAKFYLYHDVLSPGSIPNK